jgi:Ser/Thr protein kinase RdoA (MazF antagonist)
MAVYTDVGVEELAAFLGAYDLGDLLAYKGIAEGVENSNFLLHTSRGYYILTLYEKRVAARDLPFFLGLMEHLAARGLTCPQPVKNRAGETPSVSPTVRPRSSRFSTACGSAGRARPTAPASAARSRSCTSPAPTSR